MNVDGALGGIHMPPDGAGKQLFGFAHFHVRPWARNGIPDSFEFDSLPFVEDDVTEVLELAMNRVPTLQ